MQYDLEANIISWELSRDDPITHAREFGNFIIHLSAKSKPVLIEILDASKLVGQLGKLENKKELEPFMPSSN